MWIKQMAKIILDSVKEKRIMQGKLEGKCIVSASYSEIVVSPEDAITLLDIYSRAEKYEHHTNYTTKEESHHVWDMPSLINVKSIPLSLYQCAKLAGKREDK
jgi:hypothetical protein